MLYKLATVLAIIIIGMGIKCEGQHPPIPIPSETFSGITTGFIKYASQENWSLYFTRSTLQRYYAGDGMNGKQVLNESIVGFKPNSELLTAWIWILIDEPKKSTWLIHSNDPKTCHKLSFTKLQKFFIIDKKDFTFTGSQKYFNGKLDLYIWTSNPPHSEKNKLNFTTMSFDQNSNYPFNFFSVIGNTISNTQFISFDPTKPDDKVFTLPDICKESSYKLNLTTLKRKAGIPTTRTHPFLHL